MNAALLDRVRALAASRRELADAQARIAAEQQRFENETRPLRLAVNQAKDAVAAAELTVRTLAVEAYLLTGDKKPAPGTEIKVRAAYDIDETAGLAWAREKQMCLVPEALDVAAVKKLATVTPLPFVTVRHEPQAQISTDLDKALAAVESIEAVS